MGEAEPKAQARPETLRFEGNSIAEQFQRKREIEQAIAENRPPIPPSPQLLEGAKAKVLESQRMAVSTELRKLLVNYCASCIQAIELTEVSWVGLARTLGTKPEFLQQAANVAEESGGFWQEVLHERIRRVGSSRTFRDVSWERLESKTLELMLKLVESGYIKDSGALLAIAAHSRKINVQDSSGSQSITQQTQVNVTFASGAEGESALPPAGSRMAIDLSPRLATALASKQQAQTRSSRIIDGEMLNAKELRELHDARNSKLKNESEQLTEGVTTDE